MHWQTLIHSIHPPSIQLADDSFELMTLAGAVLAECALCTGNTRTEHILATACVALQSAAGAGFTCSLPLPRGKCVSASSGCLLPGHSWMEVVVVEHGTGATATRMQQQGDQECHSLQLLLGGPRPRRCSSLHDIYSPP